MLLGYFFVAVIIKQLANRRKGRESAQDWPHSLLFSVVKIPVVFW